jgi:formylglycine-generating enzyme required for sulfatase activity
VTIRAPFAAGKFEVTRGQFAAFVQDTGRETTDACITYENGSWEARTGRTWSDPGFPQDASHAVDCVTFDDAESYVAWLSRKTGKAYRLLTEAEWEYAARAGATTRYFSGDDGAALCRSANGADHSAKALFPDWTWSSSCDDGHPFTAPVGTFEPNAFGLYDVTGNVWEWVSDCFHDSYDGAPGDGSSWAEPSCEFRTVRGGGLFDSPGVMRLSFRIKATPDDTSFERGFRVARTIVPQQ